MTHHQMEWPEGCSDQESANRARNILSRAVWQMRASGIDHEEVRNCLFTINGTWLDEVIVSYEASRK